MFEDITARVQSPDDSCHRYLPGGNPLDAQKPSRPPSTQASLWAYASDVEQPAVIRIPGAPPILIHNPSTLQDNVAHSAPLPTHSARWFVHHLPPLASIPSV